MKYLLLALTAMLLSACSIQGMVEKAVPESVRADHAAHIDRLLERDTSRLENAFNLDPQNEETQAQLDSILDNVPEGGEIRRDYVGMNTASSFTTGEGKSRDINLVSEIQTQGGYMTVTTQYALDPQGECCRITNLNVEKFETSPVREALESVKRVAKIIGIIFLIGILALVFFLVRRRKKKRVAST